MGTIKSGVALLNVLESWGVEHVYGIPGGSFNSMMHALYDKRNAIRFIQVRHEETGAIAASVDAKLTGRIGVCSGTAGPGVTHLFNGLYDAKMDRVPVLALVGQVSSRLMNYDYFQEMDEDPMFADVSVYNRTVMTPQSLPFVVDEAIRRAIEYKGVAIVTIPVDFGYVDIPDEIYSTARNFKTAYPAPAQKDIEAAVRLIEAAERPILYVGKGTRGALEQIMALSEQYSLPILTSVLAKGIVPDKTENLMGTAGRLSSKPANEALAVTDLIVFVGSDFPFGRFMFPREAKFIQVDIDPSKFGKRHPADVTILADAGRAMQEIAAAGAKKPVTKWLEANRENRRNWLKWQDSFGDRDTRPLRPEPVFREINRIAEEHAIFVTDVGNVTILAVRLLNMNGGRHMFTTSGLFATMGYGVPGGIAAKLSFPDRQVFTLSGDGGFTMAMQDIITQVKYGLPVINVVFSNDSLGFIDAEQEDTKQPLFGTDLAPVDFAGVARSMGARGFTVTRFEELPGVFDKARTSETPVVIDVKIGNRRPFPAEAMILDSERYQPEEIGNFIKRYEVTDMPLLKDLLK